MDSTKMNNARDEIDEIYAKRLTGNDESIAPRTAVEAAVDAGDSPIHSADTVAADYRRWTVAADDSQRDARVSQTGDAAASDGSPRRRGCISLAKDSGGDEGSESKNLAVVSWLDHAYHRGSDDGRGCDRDDRASFSDESEGDSVGGGSALCKLATNCGGSREDDVGCISLCCGDSNDTSDSYDSEGSEDSTEFRTSGSEESAYDSDDEAGYTSDIASHPGYSLLGASSVTDSEPLISGSSGDSDDSGGSDGSDVASRPSRELRPYADLSRPPSSEPERENRSCGAATGALAGRRESRTIGEERHLAEPPIDPGLSTSVFYERLRDSSTEDDSSDDSDAKNAEPACDDGPPELDLPRQRRSRRQNRRC